MITLQDLIDRFGAEELAQLTDRENAAVIDEVVINRAISDAEGEVEGYLNAVGLVGRDGNGALLYVHSANTPKALTLKTCDIARYYLHDDGVIEIVKERYTQAIDWLTLVMKKPTMLTGVPKPIDSHSDDAGIHVIPNAIPNQYQG